MTDDTFDFFLRLILVISDNIIGQEVDRLIEWELLKLLEFTFKSHLQYVKDFKLLCSKIKTISYESPIIIRNNLIF